MIFKILRIFFASALLIFVSKMSYAKPSQTLRNYSIDNVIDAGANFFNTVSTKMASVVESITRKYGQPNGYITGSDSGGAFIGGITYGEGAFSTRDHGTNLLFWQGPSIGYDFGAQASKVFILVYNLTSVEDIYRRFIGVEGSGYLVAGFGFNIMKSGNVILVPIRSGVGARLGINIGYLKVTKKATWNPF